MRQIVAILIAPLTPALVMILFAMVVSMSWPFNQSDYRIIIGVASAVSYTGFFAVGLPVLYFLKRYSKLTLLSISLAGGVSGSVIFGLVQFIAAFLLGSTAEYGLLTLLWGFLSGVCVAVSYGLISGITIAGRATV